MTVTTLSFYIWYFTFNIYHSGLRSDRYAVQTGVSGARHRSLAVSPHFITATTLIILHLIFYILHLIFIIQVCGLTAMRCRSAWAAQGPTYHIGIEGTIKKAITVSRNGHYLITKNLYTLILPSTYSAVNTIEFKLFVRFSSPFAFLSLTLRVKVDWLAVFRFSLTDTYNRSLQFIVPAILLCAGSSIRETKDGLVISSFHLLLSSK